MKFQFMLLFGIILVIGAFCSVPAVLKYIADYPTLPIMVEQEKVDKTAFTEINNHLYKMASIDSTAAFCEGVRYTFSWLTLMNASHALSKKDRDSLVFLNDQTLAHPITIEQIGGKNITCALPAISASHKDVHNP